MASISLDESLGLNSHTLGHGGWILMTSVPGAPVASDDLDEATMADLAGQLGDIVTSWRRNIPAQPHCGNIRLPRGAAETGEISMVERLDIRGILQEGIDVENPITSANDYYRIKLTDKLRGAGIISHLRSNKIPRSAHPSLHRRKAPTPAAHDGF